MGEDKDETKAHPLDSVLRVVARHTSMLQEDAFEELSAALSAALPFARMSVLVPDGPLSLRVFARSPRREGGIPFGSRLPCDTGIFRGILIEQKPLTVGDLLLATDAERSLASDDVRSYVLLPIRVQGPSFEVTEGSGDGEGLRAIAVLGFFFFEPNGGRHASLGWLQRVADLVGPSIERAMQLSREHRLAMILETSSDAMLAWDRHGSVTDANAAASVLTGRRRRELIGTSIAALLDPVPEPGAVGLFTEGVRLSLISRTREGERRVVVAASVSAVHDDALVTTHALLRDLSHTVQAEQDAAARLARIRELEEQHRTLLDNAPLLIFRLDPVTLELVYLNRHAERLLGIPTAEALRTPGFLRSAHADPEGADAFDAAVARARIGAESLPYEARFLRRSGDEIAARGTVYPLLTERGRVAAIEGVLADVSGEHAARTRLVQADRLSTLGTLAAGVAHEINNPAAFILLGLDLLDRLLSSPGVRMEPHVAGNVGETLRELRESIRRIVDIARDLRLFAGPPVADAGRRTVVDVNRTVESALSLTRGQILERAQIERRLTEVPPVLMDDGRLGQVLVNLLVNAAQAIPKAYAAEQQIRVATKSDGTSVTIEVSDTGVGIAEEYLPRIWQPFFTTKTPDVGTGLGLSISREIIERAGGTISVESPVRRAPEEAAPSATGTVESEPPWGTRFMITLPAAGGHEAPPQSSPTPGMPAVRARVLIVEDEAPLLRALAEEVGRRHEVAIASGAEAALEAMGIREFDVVLCDLRMPGMSGEALYRKVLDQTPQTAAGFIFMTGVGFGADVEKFLRESGRPVLEKPFPASVALETITKVAKKMRSRVTRR